MSDPRPDLGTVRTQYQVPDDVIINYRPRAYGVVDIPYTEKYAVSITQTEGALLDRLTRDRGLVGLSAFRDHSREAFALGEARFPDNPLPQGIPADQAADWQGNDGHRDAFRHAFWSARLAQEYGSDWARAFTSAHEGRPGNPANREAMDLYNNSIGIQIGAQNPRATPEALADLIEQAVRQGKTVVMDSSGQLAWSDRVPVGQHGLSPDDVIGPHKAKPDVVSTQSVAQVRPAADEGRAGAAQAVAASSPTLSPDSQAVLTDSERHVRQLAERHGLRWDQGLDNTVAAVAHRARADGLTGISHFKVGDGQIRFAQHDGFSLKEGRLDAQVAANTPVLASREGLAQMDAVMCQVQQDPGAEPQRQAMSVRA